MLYKKLNRTLMLLLLSILILGLTACGGQDESEAPSATTAEEKAAEGAKAEAPAQTEETSPAAEGPEEAIEVREATTVMAAIQMINLHKLPLPDEAELMGQPEPGSLRYQAPIEVAAAVDLHRSALTDQGWQENIELGHAEEVTASAFFSKEDFTLSLSASDMGDGKAMVSLTNHGNIDLRALPQMDDAEELFNFPGSLGYVSATDVTGVADFTRRKLAAQGWHEYTRPHTDMADDPERQHLTLIQNGLELSVSVGVAPAQGGKTSVQYGVSVLPLDLPVPDDAAGVELEKMLLNLSVSYTTPDDFETLLDYYSREMTALGWVEISDMGIMTPERTTRFFGNENVPPHTLVLDLGASDGQTSATLRYYEVDEITELNTPGTSSPSDESPPMAGGEMPAIPIPGEAQDVAYDADLGEINYTTLSDAETVTEFYRQALSADGWQADEDSVMANDVFVNITFERGEESIDISSKDVSVPTRVTVNIRYAPSLTGESSAEIETNVGDTIEMGDFAFTVTEVTSPEDMAYPPQEGNTFLQIVFTVENRHASDTFDSFYSLWLSIEDSDGWGYGYDELGFTEVGGSNDSYGSHNGQIEPYGQTQGRTIFQVPVDAGELFLVVEAPDLGDDKAFVALPETEAPPTTGSAADASAANLPNFLIPADAQNVVYDTNYGSISYVTTDMEAAIEFYRQSLSAEGWQEDEDFSSVSETFSFVIFYKDADTLQVNLFQLEEDEIEVSVDISSALSLLGSIESGSGDDTAGDSGPLTLVEEEGFPVPSDNAHWQPEDWQSDMRQTVAFASPSSIEALAELYETELPKQGWEFIGSSLAGPEGHLYFEGNDGQELFVNLRTEGNLTGVELVIRNPAAAAELGVVMPPDGQSRVYFGSIVEEEVTVTIDGQDFTLPPGDMAETLDDAQYVDLSAGAYTVTANIPDLDEEAGEEIEVKAGEVWTVMAGPGGLLVIQAY